MWDGGPVLSSHLHHVTIDPFLGCSQAVPLVPLTEENEEAMENEQFQQLLQKLRVRPPASGQVNTPVTASTKHVGATLRYISSSFPVTSDRDSCSSCLANLSNLPFS